MTSSDTTMLSSKSSPVVDLHVVIYRPREGNYFHWAFHTYNTKSDEHQVFQVEGLENELERTVLTFNPESFMRVVRQILVGHMREIDLKQAAQAIEEVEIQNEVATWDCQDYVIDIMDALDDIGLLGSFRKYEAVKKAVKKMRGDTDSTSKMVANYDYEALRHEDEDSEDEKDEEDTEGEDEDDDDEEPNAVRSAARIEDSDEDE